MLALTVIRFSFDAELRPFITFAVTAKRDTKSCFDGTTTVLTCDGCALKKRTIHTKGVVVKIPKTIKVAGHTVKILNNYKFHERRDVDGHSNLSDNYMILGDDVKSESERAMIFLHEICHFVLYRYLGDSSFLSERDIQSLTEGIFQVLRDNKLDFSKEKPKRKN